MIGSGSPRARALPAAPPGARGRSGSWYRLVATSLLHLAERPQDVGERSARVALGELVALHLAARRLGDAADRDHLLDRQADRLQQVIAHPAGEGDEVRQG